MLGAKLLTSPMRQAVGPTTCRALAHTDIQFPDYSAFRRPSTLHTKKKNIETEGQRKVFSHLTTATVSAASPIKGKSAVTKVIASSSPTKDDLALASVEVKSSDIPPGKNGPHDQANTQSQLATLYFNQFPKYCQMITDAKSRAKRSILIDHCGTVHIDLKDKFNNIEHVYSIEKETKKGLTRLSLIEFRTQDDAEITVKQARHNGGLLPVALKVFRYVGDPNLPEPSQQNLSFPVEHVRLPYNRELSPVLNSYSDLIANNLMSFVALKMRFITLVNFERLLCAGVFEEYELMPFGSSVIDIGSDSGDLDLLMTRKVDHYKLIQETIENNSSQYTQQQKVPQSSLLHLDKSLYNEARDNQGVRGPMRLFDHLLREYVPLTDGFRVQYVPHAKVPIIKFTAQIVGIECDLSFDFGLDYREREILTTNYSAIIMSQILYSLCRTNNLFTAVVTYLRVFAKVKDITSKEPSVGFTNFQLLSLILFYLQQISISSHVPSSGSPKSNESTKKEFVVVSSKAKHAKPVIPPFKNLLNTNLLPSDCPPIVLNNEQLNQLVPKVIKGFFEYYSSFDFNNNSLNLYESRIEKKLDNSPIYVLNPLDRSRNICRSVNWKGLENFIVQTRKALGELRSSKNSCPLSLMKTLLQQYQEQTRKKKTLKFDSATQEFRGSKKSGLRSDDIARDVCR